MPKTKTAPKVKLCSTSATEGKQLGFSPPRQGNAWLFCFSLYLRQVPRTASNSLCSSGQAQIHSDLPASASKVLRFRLAPPCLLALSLRTPLLASSLLARVLQVPPHHCQQLGTSPLEHDLRIFPHFSLINLYLFFLKIKIIQFEWEWPS